MSVATRRRRRRPTSAVQFLDADRRGNVTCDPSPLGVPGGPASSLPLSLSHLAQQRFLLLIDVPLKNAKVVVVPSEVTELMTGAARGRARVRHPNEAFLGISLSPSLTRGPMTFQTFVSLGARARLSAAGWPHYQRSLCKYTCRGLETCCLNQSLPQILATLDNFSWPHPTSLSFRRKRECHVTLCEATMSRKRCNYRDFESMEG